MKTIEEIKNDIKIRWTDEQGFITLNPASWSDPLNGLYDSENQCLWTAIYYQFLYELRVITEEDKIHIRNLINKLRVKPGVFNRHPDYRDRIFSRDEQTALCILGSIASVDIAKEICQHGISTGWNFDNRSDSKWSIEGMRQYQDIMFFKLMAGYKPHPFEIVWSGVALIFTFIKPPEETSSKLLWWYKIRTLTWEYSIFEPVKVFTYKKYRKQYGDKPIKKMFEIYFRHKDHPFHDLIKL